MDIKPIKLVLLKNFHQQKFHLVPILIAQSMY